MFHIGNSPRFSEEKLKELPYLLPEDVANAVMYVLGTPPHVQVCFLRITFVLNILAHSYLLYIKTMETLFSPENLCCYTVLKIYFICRYSGDITIGYDVKIFKK